MVSSTIRLSKAGNNSSIICLRKVPNPAILTARASVHPPARQRSLISMASFPVKRSQVDLPTLTSIHFLGVTRAKTSIPKVRPLCRGRRTIVPSRLTVRPVLPEVSASSSNHNLPDNLFVIHLLNRRHPRLVLQSSSSHIRRLTLRQVSPSHTRCHRGLSFLDSRRPMFRSRPSQGPGNRSRRK